MTDPDILTELVYEAAFMPDLWNRVLDDLARSIGGQGTVLFNSRDASMRYRTSDGIRDLIDRIVAEGWMTRRNHRAERLMALKPFHGFSNEAEHFTQVECDDYPVYVELMRPSGYGFGAATVIVAPSGDNMVFSVERKTSAKPFGAPEIAFLDAMRPHLARASLIASRLEFERLNAAMQALELTGLPSAILTEDGRVLAANASFHGYGPEMEIGAGDRLVLHRTAAAKRLADSLRRIAKGGKHAAASFPLPKGATSPPAIVHLVPVERSARDIFVRASCFLIVTPVDRSRVPSADAIQGLFDLTPAEARVAARLCAGEDVAAIADALTLSTNTIRSHVRAILGKSGMSRQTDFVACVASIHPIG